MNLPSLKIRCGTYWPSSLAFLVAVCGIGLPMQSRGDKIQLSTPEKKSSAPAIEAPVPKRRKPGGGFEFLERGNSTGGAIEAPNVAPTGPGAAPDPRVQKRLLEVLEKERSRSNGLGESTEGLSPDSLDEVDPNDVDESGIESLDRRERIRRAMDKKSENLELTDELDRDPKKRRPGAESKRGSRDSGKVERYDPASTARRFTGNSADRRDRLDPQRSLAPESLEFSDPFSPSESRGLGGGYLESFGDSKSFGGSGTDGRTTSGGNGDAGLAVDRENTRQREFQSVLSGETTGASAGALGGVGAARGGVGVGAGGENLSGLGRSSTERQAQFKALLSGSSSAYGTGTSGSGYSPSGAISAGAPRPSIPSLSSSFPGASAPSSLPTFSAPAPALRGPSVAPQPIRLVTPGRSF